MIGVNQRTLADGRLTAIIENTGENRRVSATGDPQFVQRALTPTMREWELDLDLSQGATARLVVIPGQEQFDDVGEAPANGSGPVSTFD